MVQSILDILSGIILGKLALATHRQINPIDLLDNVIMMERYGNE
jgi:hypothetical protein